MPNRIIYKITNKINGKVYIGQTKQGLTRRKAEHITRFNLCERDHKIYQAMRKYGIENFEFSEVCSEISENSLDELECQVISDYDSFNNGYNMTCGGDTISEETREKISKAHKGRKITWYHKILESRKANPDRKDPKEYVPRGSKNTQAKWYLIRYPDGREEVICGLKDFCKKHGLNFCNMYAVLRGDQSHHKGYALLRKFNDHPGGEYA